MILIASKEEKRLVEHLRASNNGASTLEHMQRTERLTAEVVALKRQIAELEVTKSKALEEFEKRERELRHMIGLEKARMEQERTQLHVEIAQSGKSARLEVREENLKAEQQRFAEQLRFNTERFEKMEVYLKDMTQSILARLPDVNVRMKVKDGE